MALIDPELDIAALVRGDYGNQTARWDQQAANPYWGFGGRPGNLTPEQLAQLQQGIVPDGYTLGVGGYDYRTSYTGIDEPMDPYYVLYQGMEDPTWGTAKANAWDLNGRYLGYGSGDSELRGLVKAAALAAAMYGGASYGANAMGGEAAAGGGTTAAGGGTLPASGTTAYGAGGSSITLPTTAEMAAGMTPASAAGASASLAPLSIAPAATGSALTGAAGKAAATTAAQQAMQQGGSDNSTGSLWEAGAKALTGGGGWGDVAGGLLGAYLGYQDSKDKENTSKTEPWGPAQPYLKGLLGEGASIYGQYKQRPFSPTEQNAYSNYGNVLDFINANAPGLMSGFDATAAGKNQFSRNNPRRGLIGNSYDAATSPVAWNPGLLGSFGTRKG